MPRRTASKRTFSSKRTSNGKRRTASKRTSNSKRRTPSKRTSKSMVVRGGALLVELAKDGEMYGHHKITLSDEELEMTCEKVVIPLLQKLQQAGESVDYGIPYTVKVDGRTPKQNHTLGQAIRENIIEDGVLHSIFLSNPNPHFSAVGGKK